MEDLFSGIRDQVELASRRIFAFHNAVVDVVYQVPLTKKEYIEKLSLGEQRFDGKKSTRIGGGGINFALSAASAGYPGISFVGFMDGEALSLVEEIKRKNGIDFPIIYSETTPRRNTILELKDDNLLYHDPESQKVNTSSPEAEQKDMIAKLALLAPRDDDWIASCSLYPHITFPLIGRSKRLFIDSGYGYPRREKMMVSALLGVLREKKLSEVVIAANETEVQNIAEELGKAKGDALEKGYFAASRMSNESGNPVRILLHTSMYSAFIESGNPCPWIVPSFDISALRRTNAGDTFAGAFIAAYDATGSPEHACFFANASSAKRLATDEFASRENMRDFLRRSRLKEARIHGVRTLGAEDLRETRYRLASSVYMRASPVSARPALQTAK
jgi:sugar/nucleoside kinase (ribokinase family)